MFVIAGKRNLVLRGCKSETKLREFMESEKESPEFNRDLYPSIEPYSSGFLKVSDIHTIYWEQSGNPNGHVSSFSNSHSVSKFSVLFIYKCC